MGLLSRVGRLALGARRGGARTLAKEARDTGEGLNALANYLMITGALGGVGGGLAGAYGEQEAGGDPNEGFIGGAQAGAIAGPLTLGPALGGTMMLGPVGATPLIPGALAVQDGASRKRREREEAARQEAAIRRALEMQLMASHQR